ncbi:MAG: hypothetical protein ACJ8B9_08245, partial [Microvirga sp.]
RRMMASADWIPSFNATMSVFRGACPHCNVEPGNICKGCCEILNRFPCPGFSDEQAVGGRIPVPVD